MALPEPLVFGIALSSGCVQVMLAVVLWRALRYRMEWGFGWLAAAFLLGGIYNLLTPSTGLFGGDPAASAGYWLAAGSGIAALACFITGMGLYFGQARWPMWQVFGLGLIVPTVLGVLLRWLFQAPIGADLATSLVFVFCASLAWMASRRQPEAGHGLLAIALLVQPLTLALTALLGVNLLVSRAIAAIPFSLVGIALLSISLFRHNQALLQELGARTAAERELQHANEVLEQRVRERTSQLSELVDALESFNGMVSHDLRAPLRGLNGLISVGEEALRSGDIRELTEILVRQRRLGTRMADLVADMLVLSRLQKPDLKRQVFELSAVVEKVLEALAQVGTSDPHRIVRCHALGTIHADPGLIEQVLTNLLSNAIKFASLSTSPLVLVEAHHEPGEVVVSVSDNGPGFDQQYAKQLFKPFSRLHPNMEGTGLGLTIVDRIVRIHEGKVWAESAPGKGARFYFSLPEVQVSHSG